MKKVKKVLLPLMCMLLLVACNNETRQVDEEKYNAYLSYYQAILDYDNKSDSSSNFSIEVVSNKLGEDKYRYDVIISQPKIAMYNIETLVIVEDVSSAINTKEMMPSLGIFEEYKYNLVPGQIDKEKNYVEGLDLSVTSNKPTVYLGVMVSYTDKNNTQVTREYLEISGNYEEVTAQ